MEWKDNLYVNELGRVVGLVAHHGSVADGLFQAWDRMVDPPKALGLFVDETSAKQALVRHEEIRGREIVSYNQLVDRLRYMQRELTSTRRLDNVPVRAKIDEILRVLGEDL